MAELWNKLLDVSEDSLLGLPTLAWIGIGFGAAILIVLFIKAIVSLIRHFGRKKPVPVREVREIGEIGVEKLHQQGARKSQQDCFSVSPDELRSTHGLLAVVADGMGGLSDGDKVSQAAVTAMMNGFYTTLGSPERVLPVLLGMANRAVNALLGPDGVYKSGTTLIAGLIRDGAFHYLSVGDSYICLLRGGELIQLNRHHIFRDELIVRGINGEGNFQDALEHPKAAGLTSFLGMGELKYVDMPAQPVHILPGDKFILMSDGVYNALSIQELTEALSTDAGAAEALHERISAKAYSNQDNYTAVILSC